MHDNNRSCSFAHWLVVCAAALVVSCSSNASDTGGVFQGDVDDAAIDTFIPDDATEDADTGGGDAIAPDTGTDAVDPDSGECVTLGCPCDDDLDCASGYCIDARGGGRICSELCDGECSREGFDCLLLTNAEGDAVRICVEQGDSYCRPCEIVADCARLDAACIEVGDANACVTPCDSTTRCPSGAECSTVMVDGEASDFCVPVIDSCAPCLDEDGDGYGIGPECLGPDPDDDDPATYPGAPELCDDIDNDGDGDIDEGFDFASDPDNCGICGVVCTTSTTTGVCEEGRCVVESCAADYEDCDGNPDNGCETDLTDASLCGDCRVPSNLPGTPCGACGGGTFACEEDGWDTVCVGGDDDALNACGGCGLLDAVPDTACGTCSSGVWTCSDDGATITCDGDLEADATNACGGCTTLDAMVGDVCGACDGAWACDGTDALICERDLTDSDGDGVCDPDDVCEGFDDGVDDDRDGIPNACDDTPVPDCFTADDCDDDNLCTDERCVDGTCVVTNNTVSCDDGLFCNGIDTCADGECGHAGSPCAGDAVCDEAIDSCGACIDDTDCPAEMVTAWSACGDFESPCDSVGTRSRTRTTYACSDSDCVPTEVVETEACERVTEGDSCDADEIGDWGVCAYDGFCDSSGARTRSVTTYACADDVCVPTTETQTDTDSCVRATAGLICDEPDFGGWSSCGGFDDVCAEDGIRSRTVTRYTCGADACGGADTSESEPCSRDTDGAACGGPPEYTAWSDCGGFDDVCDSSGIQTRVRTELVCGGGACDTVETLEERVCSRGTDGAICGETVYSAWGACGGFESTCDNSGTQTRTRTEYLCDADGCEPVVTTESRACDRATDGTSCAADDVGAWSACGGFDGVCGEAGTRSRSRTVYACDAGSCASTTSTESGACNRDTDGATCDDVSSTAWSACGGFDGTCGESGTQSRNVTTYTCGAGTCGGATAPETRACSRDTDGTGCGSTTYTAWSACGGFENTCDNSGTQTRTRTDYLCSGAACSSTTTTESRACARNTNGDSCAADSVGAWSACGGFDGVCGEAGTRSRSRTVYACDAGSCASTTSTESGACSRDTDGATCDDASSTAWSACGGFDGTCGESGSQSRNVTTYTCGGGSCGGSTAPQTRGCSRDTDGTGCGSTTYTAWSACGGFENTCDNSGTQTRTRTDYSCSGAACSSTTTTESRACSRNTNGDSCAADSVGAWSACGGYLDACDESGTRSRSRTVYACDAGSCASTTSTESGACSRNTDGVTCADTSATGWSSCDGFTGICDESGTQSRTVTTYTCGDGTCSGAPAPQTRACSRDTDGTGCGSSTYTAWSACGGFSSTCDNTGIQTRTRTDYSCSGATCSTSTTTESRACSRNTNGTTCASDSVSGWSACGSFSSLCDESGTRTRTRTSYTCGSGLCQSSTSSEAGACSRDTDGVTCADTSTTAWSTCSGYSGTCGESGTQSRNVTTYSCGGGSCGSASSTQSRACSRDTDGVSCGSTTYSPWTTCSGFSDACDESGTRSRTVSTYDCSSGSCVTSTTTQTGACPRDTDGLSCGSPLYGAWSTCSGFSDECDESGTRTRSVTTYTCSSGACGSSRSPESGACSRDTDGSWCSSFVDCTLGRCSAGSCDSIAPPCDFDETCCEPGICVGPFSECP